MLMNNSTVVLLKKSVSEYLHLLKLKKKTLRKTISIEIKDVRGIISKNYPVKEGFSSKIYFGTSKEADVI